MKEHWNQRYAESKHIYGTRANLFFEEELAKLKPASILLPGDGEGRNSLHAAKQMWRVDAFDYSDQAVKNAKEFCNSQNVEVNFYLSSILDHENVKAKYNALGFFYLHLDSKDRPAAHQFITDSLKPGGVLIMEVFSKNQLGRNTGGPRNQDMLYSLTEIQNDFKEFEFILLEELEVELSEGELHNGKAMVIRCVGRKKNI